MSAERIKLVNHYITQSKKRRTMPWPHDLEIWVMKGGLKIQLLRKKRYEFQNSAAEMANKWNARHVPADMKGLYEQAFITPLAPSPWPPKEKDSK